MFFRQAVLIVHGFAGGTYDEEKLANYLELNRNFDVFQFTLKGHERNFSKVKYQEWIKSSEDMMDWLISKGYKKIYLIGHSMGGVIATYLSTKYKEVKKLVLAAPAFQYLDVIDDNLNIKESLMKTPKVIKTYGSEEIIARLFKLNIGAVKEFMTLVKEYYHYPKNVTCDTLILQGDNDNLVPLTSSKYVYDNVKGKKTLIYLKGITHDVFRNEREEEIFKLVEHYLKYGLSKGIEKI